MGGKKKMDERIKKLAKNIISYSLNLQKGERLLIEAKDCNPTIIKALVAEAYSVGAYPYVTLLSSEISRALLLGESEERIALKSEFDLEFMKKMDAYITIRGAQNIFETSDVPSERVAINTRHTDKVRNERVNNTKWVLLMAPSEGLAQSAKMSTEEYEDFYFKVCNLDYSKMSKAMDNLVEVMEKTDRVRLVAPGTDISFSIKGIPAIKCAGNMNIPDGEVFTAPVKNSINGKISYNLPTSYNGTSFSNICLEVKDGKIVKATGTNEEKLNSILNTDEGARYFGEFSLGVNPYITRGFEDILFDEKMAGSIHFTPGCCYENEAPNGNISSIHWDMVLSMLPQHGGGEIYFDDVLIRKDGLFVIDKLKCLNPENLI